ncbi:plasmid replication protein, CyRepA1 family [Crocosphaera sp. UHCC 0190]|uniref:plasmid replication protein, CyRepA1 family n=1 Tax=Crocosphaera sp. UHCC 0190 TaxID=3110246 RepID=UPI002B204368|nr:plasmid replication protein, CyRepA1 family [Crocosphaera sp. UHCC 0190]MEA5512306.1 plasmid replication protein, CyRepA1 family [Crocosphaera sp. UHCC 0190]
MSNWKRFTRRDTCPVCNGDRPDCRQSLETNLIHCRSLDANPSDYLYRGQDTWGFGMWAYKPDADEWADDRREERLEERKRERELKKQQREQRDKEQLKKLLPIKERDRVIRLILDQLELSDRHRQILRGRGFIDTQIDEAGYRSVKQWQKLSKPVDNRLSGVNQQGNKLNNNTDGILIPVPNEDGLYTALRVNNLDSATNELGKYLWVSSKNSRGIPIDLPNGNLPIAVYLPDSPPKKPVIGFTEGLEYKPLLTAKKLGIPVIGASGGNFASSKEAVETAIATIKDKYGWETVNFVLYADAGSAINSNVTRAYEKLGEFISDLKIADWGQLNDKENGLDIDEVAPNEIDIKLIDIEVFSDIANRQQYKAQIEKKQHKLNYLTKEINLLIDEPTLEGILDQLPRKGKLFIKSPKQSRKSSAIIDPLIKEWKKKNQPIISIVPRILLYKEQVERWEITAIDQYGNLHREFHESIALCFDSLGKINFKNWSGALVIFDEIRQGLKHYISSSTLEDMRSYILKLLQEKLPEAINSGGLIVCADADLTDVEIDYIDAICPVSDTFIVKNEYVPQKGLVNFNTGKYDETIEEINRRYENGENLFIFCDSKADSLAIHKRLKQLDPDATHWLINGDTSEDKEVKAIIEDNINKSIKKQKPRSLVFTTSMSTGISLDGWIDGVFHEDIYNHFDYGFVIAQGGILEPVEITQAMERNRNYLDFSVYSGQGINRNDEEKSCDPDVIKRQITKRNHKGLDLIGLTTEVLEEKLGREPTHLEVLNEMAKRCDPKTEMIIDPHLDLYANTKARANYAAQNFEEMLYKQLIKEGYQLAVNDCTEKTALGDEHRKLKKEEKWIEATETSKAKDITLEEAQEITLKNSTKEERREAAKAFLKQELPGIDLTPDFIHKATLKDGRRWLNAHKLFWYYQHPEITREIDQGHYLKKIKQFSQGVIFLPNIRNYSVKINELRELGFFELINLENPTELSKDDPRVVEFMKRAYSRWTEIYTALGSTVSKKTEPIKFIQTLAQKVGLKVILTRTEEKEKDKIRYYSLSTEVLNDPDRLAVLNALDQRFLEDKPQKEEFSESLNIQGLESRQESLREYITMGCPVVQESESQDGLSKVDDEQNYSPLDDPNLESLKPLYQPDEDMFWWGKLKERFDPEVEVKVHLVYWEFLSLTSRQSWQNVKGRVRELSLSLGYQADDLAWWVFNNMPDEERDLVRDFLKAA